MWRILVVASCAILHCLPVKQAKNQQNALPEPIRIHPSTVSELCRPIESARIAWSEAEVSLLTRGTGPGDKAISRE